MATVLLMSTSELRYGDDLFDGVPGPSVTLRRWPEVGDASEIDYLLIWGAPQAALSTFPNLKAVFSLGAGVDHLGDLSAWPDTLPIIRFVDPSLTDEMTGWVVLNVLRFHRQDPAYRAQQADKIWQAHLVPPASAVRVGIAGAGVLGLAAAEALAGLGYDVAVWSRTGRALDGLQSFTGPGVGAGARAGALDDFLARTDMLVSLLPLTEETRGIWNEERFARLPRGAFVLNAGRGKTLVEADLLAALESGQVAGAALDVFESEPLAETHPFWSHPKVIVSPHMASLTHPKALAARVAENIGRLERGVPVEGLVDRTRGY